MLNWNDLKYFLAMAESGSLSGAAKKLRVSQPTLSRRLTTLEESIGKDLFARTRNGLELTAIGEQLIHHAQHMKDDVHAIERLVTGEDQALKGSVSISAIEMIGAGWLVEQMKPFHDQFSNITVEINVENNTVDLLRREADIALRMFRPNQSDLIARKTVTIHYSYYASKDYIEKHGMPTYDNLKDHNAIIPGDEMMARVKAGPIKSKLFEMKPVFRSNSLMSLYSAVKAGYGVGACICIFGDNDPDLVRLFDNHIVVSTDLWLVSHAELKRSARIRAVYDYLGDMLLSNKAAFAGLA
ncbi:LysR family transcriptional regulator [Kordiimonas sediminis]|uniref:LysR family transcriptional regulator n=1 Tax=Kordiimonas sediminis TaxID=1735581 RepID=A0A919AWK2_9PROT|nr:LysR family transcriptional regulator [Kordiimonas sediminis]GHF26555.1 LysR family transcriptional regulator [Kordiimonas sediminis]